MQTEFIREVSARYSKSKKKRFAITDARDVVKFLTEKVIKDNTKEHMVLLSLDGAHTVASYSVISVGTANACQFHPREIFQVAILSGAVSIIIAHNHPSGTANPSEADHAATAMIKDAGKILGIKLLDHVVVTDHPGTYYSYQENGRL